ncbi:MAG: hypothetical protein PHI94_06825 [Eubacteriaceae bacterium]|jgi:hypothetical protein|nr:hypothetical protein [Eubacteriaceae bacterium]
MEISLSSAENSFSLGSNNHLTNNPGKAVSSEKTSAYGIYATKELTFQQIEQLIMGPFFS